VQAETLGPPGSPAFPAGDSHFDPGPAGDSHFDPGPADPRSAIAEYNIVTGEFIVSVNDVWNWSLGSSGQFTGPDYGSIRDVLPAGDPRNFVSTGLSIVQEATLLHEPFTYTNVNLGRIVEPGIDVAEFRLKYSAPPEGYTQHGEILVVPEPGTVWLLAVGAVMFSCVVCRKALRVRRATRR